MIVENENGGKQSYIPVRYDLVPPQALYAAAVTLAQGAEKYGELNWQRISTNDHLNHAIAHIMVFLSGKHSNEEDLAHAIVRLMFAYDTDYFGVVINREGNSAQQPNFVESFAQAANDHHSYGK